MASCGKSASCAKSASLENGYPLKDTTQVCRDLYSCSMRGLSREKEIAMCFSAHDVRTLATMLFAITSNKFTECVVEVKESRSMVFSEDGAVTCRRDNPNATQTYTLVMFLDNSSELDGKLIYPEEAEYSYVFVWCSKMRMPLTRWSLTR